MWEKIGKACGWRHRKAPSVRKILDDEIATEAVLALLRGTRLDVWFHWRPRGGEAGGVKAEEREGGDQGALL